MGFKMSVSMLVLNFIQMLGFPLNSSPALPWHELPSMNGFANLLDVFSFKVGAVMMPALAS